MAAHFGTAPFAFGSPTANKNKPFILANIELKRVKVFNNLTAPLEIPDDYTKMEIK